MSYFKSFVSLIITTSSESSLHRWEAVGKNNVEGIEIFRNNFIKMNILNTEVCVTIKNSINNYG